jgi:hypothetical protein
LVLSVNFCENTSLISFINSGDNCAEARNAADRRHRAGLVDGGDLRERDAVEQHVGAGGAVRLDQHLEAHRRRGAGYRHLEIDFRQHRGAADAHGGDRRIDLHVAMLGGGAGDEGDGALDEAEERGIVRPVGVVDHLVQHHPGVGGEAEHRAVDERDAECRVGPRLHHVALMDVVAIVEDDRHTVADNGGAAGELGDMADDLGGGGAAVGLRDLHMAGQHFDRLAGEIGAVGRSQRRALVALEIVRQHQFLVIPGDDEVEAGPLEVAVEEKIGVLDDDRIRRRPGVHRLDLQLRLRVGSRKRQAAIEFGKEIQAATANG